MRKLFVQNSVEQVMARTAEVFDFGLPKKFKEQSAFIIPTVTNCAFHLLKKRNL
jgi:hypothetical protein